jgi:hypothetical protein
LGAGPQHRAGRPAPPIEEGSTITWFKVDDGFHHHRKVLSIPRGQRRLAAVGAWTLVGSWCAANGTDGQFGSEVLEELGIPSKCASDLLAAGLWEQTDRHTMHDYLDYNPSAEKVAKDRREAAERQRRARDAARRNRGGRA